MAAISLHSRGTAQDPTHARAVVADGVAPSLTGVTVAQLGARMHYAVPRILHGASALTHLYTDICVSKSWPQLVHAVPEGLRTPSIHRLAARMPVGVDADRLTAFNRFGLSYAYRRSRTRSPAEAVAVDLWAGSEFCKLVTQHGFKGASTVYAYNSAAFEVFLAARAHGVHPVLEQTIAPRELCAALVLQEHDAFPGWELSRWDTTLTDEFAERERAEWDLADLIVCGSEFVKRSIADCGGPGERCVVVPYGVDLAFSFRRRKVPGDRLRVLTVGEVGLRKGAPYVAAAAKRAGSSVEFRMVGEVRLTASARAELEAHVDLVGPVPRSKILSHYQWADVFLLPSICEGSATVIYEALASGLPVICTPNAGSIVRDGIEGFIVPIRDPDAIVGCLDRLSDSELWHMMSTNARRTAASGHLSAYGHRLLSVLASL